MQDFFFGHYGLDWAAAIFLFLSMWRLGGHHRDGFILAGLASAFWIAFNLQPKVDSEAGVIANAIILIMSIMSFVRYAKTKDPEPAPTQPTVSDPAP